MMTGVRITSVVTKYREMIQQKGVKQTEEQKTDQKNELDRLGEGWVKLNPDGAFSNNPPKLQLE